MSILVAGHPGGAHYTIRRLEGIADVREIFHERTDYALNWLFVGTSGVHGSYASLDAVAEMLTRPEDDDTYHSATLLIVQPRLVKTSYGHIPVTQADIPFLRDCVRRTLDGVARSQQGST